VSDHGGSSRTGRQEPLLNVTSYAADSDNNARSSGVAAVRGSPSDLGHSSRTSPQEPQSTRLHALRMAYMPGWSVHVMLLFDSRHRCLVALALKILNSRPVAALTGMSSRSVDPGGPDNEPDVAGVALKEHPSRYLWARIVRTSSSASKATRPPCYTTPRTCIHTEEAAAVRFRASKLR
jgi:hypothetical protein